jgi:hypothetical protein
MRSSANASPVSHASPSRETAEPWRATTAGFAANPSPWQIENRNGESGIAIDRHGRTMNGFGKVAGQE